MINLPVRSSVVISAGAAIVLAVSRTNKEQDIIRIIAGSMDLWQSNHINHMLRSGCYHILEPATSPPQEFEKR